MLADSSEVAKRMVSSMSDTFREVDEDDGSSGFEDDLFGDKAGKEDLVKNVAKKFVSFLLAMLSFAYFLI